MRVVVRTTGTKGELRDLLLGLPICFGGLLCFALSFTLGKPDGAPCYLLFFLSYVSSVSH
jgi:hypothetical protein